VRLRSHGEAVRGVGNSRLKRPPTGLVSVTRDEDAWTGDGHSLRLEAGDEVGLSRHEVALDSFQEGFSHGAEPFGEDAALVMHGRTILSREQFRVETCELLESIGIPQRGVVVRVDDGEFELRISRWTVAMVGATRPLGRGGGGSVGVVAGLAAAGLALGFSGLSFGVPVAMLALAGAGGVWLTYLTKARRLIAERLVEGLGRIARRDGVILPPKGR